MVQADDNFCFSWYFITINIVIIIIGTNMWAISNIILIILYQLYKRVLLFITERNKSQVKTPLPILNVLV